MTTEKKPDIESLELQFPALTTQTLALILSYYDESNNVFNVPATTPHMGGQFVEIVEHGDIFDLFCQQPKKSTPAEIEVMIVHNKQLQEFLTEECNWSKNDLFYPTTKELEGIRRGY